MTNSEREREALARLASRIATDVFGINLFDERIKDIVAQVIDARGNLADDLAAYRASVLAASPPGAEREGVTEADVDAAVQYERSTYVPGTIPNNLDHPSVLAGARRHYRGVLEAVEAARAASPRPEGGAEE